MRSATPRLTVAPRDVLPPAKRSKNKTDPDELIVGVSLISNVGG